MPIALSVYFDLVRWLAALLVFTSHAWIFFPKTRLPWPGHDAVVVFFVLSGYVVAFVADRKEQMLSEFALSRAVRILSVSVPALCFTALVSILVYPEWKHELLLIGLNAAFLAQNWSINVWPSANPVFWSLCYEVWYYAIFAGFVFPTRISAKIFCGGTLAVFAGPKILLLMPCWLLGVILYRYRDLIKLSILNSAIVFALTILAYGAFFWFDISVSIRGWLQSVDPMFVAEITASNQFLGDWILAILVGANFAAAANLASSMRSIAQALSRPINFAAGFTLSIYLFHYPSILLLQHFHVVGTLGFISALAIPLLLATFTELQRFKLRSVVRAYLKNPRRAVRVDGSAR